MSSAHALRLESLHARAHAQVVLKRAHNYDAIGKQVHDKITEFALRGFRALGVAITPDDGVPGARAYPGTAACCSPGAAILAPLTSS